MPILIELIQLGRIEVKKTPNAVEGQPGRGVGKEKYFTLDKQARASGCCVCRTSLSVSTRLLASSWDLACPLRPGWWKRVNERCFCSLLFSWTFFLLPTEQGSRGPGGFRFKLVKL